MSDRAWSLRVFSTPLMNNATARREPPRAEPASAGRRAQRAAGERRTIRRDGRARAVPSEARKRRSRAQRAAGERSQLVPGVEVDLYWFVTFQPSLTGEHPALGE